MIRLLISGYGRVGQSFLRLLRQTHPKLRQRSGQRLALVGVVRKSRGIFLYDEPAPVERIAEDELKSGDLASGGSWRPFLGPDQVVEVIAQTPFDILIELSPLDISRGQPATRYLETALRSGKDVITANKGPIAHHYRDLTRLAAEQGASLRFEGTVMDGAPIFSFVERTLPACTVTGFSGILNSTTNFVLTQMVGGASLDEAIRKAQQVGIAERDPSLDLDGWDATVKTTVLANVWLDADLKPQDVTRQGIRGIDPTDLQQAAQRGHTIKLICRAQRREGQLTASVQPEEISPGHRFFPVRGTSSAVTIETDLMGAITLHEHDPELEQTAYAVLSDLIAILG